MIYILLLDSCFGSVTENVQNLHVKNYLLGVIENSVEKNAPDLLEDLFFVPISYAGWLTIFCNFSCERSKVQFWLLCIPHMWYSPIHKHISRNHKKVKNDFHLVIILSVPSLSTFQIFSPFSNFPLSPTCLPFCLPLPLSSSFFLKKTSCGMRPYLIWCILFPGWPLKGCEFMTCLLDIMLVLSYQHLRMLRSEKKALNARMLYFSWHYLWLSFVAKGQHQLTEAPDFSFLAFPWDSS